MRVLLVDDCKDLREMLAIQLSNAGYDVRCAGNGQEACEILEKEAFDLIILDMVMPVMSGQEFLDVKRWRPWFGTPVIVVTGYAAEPHDDDEILMAVKKPFSTARLISAIEGLEQLLVSN